METTIGARVAQAIPGTLTQAALAQKIEMTPDALSRSIHGKRAFATVELARIADVLKVDLYYLVTGEPDPHRLVPSARHAYDPETRQRSVDGLTEDREICEGIHLAYRQAYPQAAGRAELPSTVEDWRERLGVGFQRDFLQRLVDAGVDVVRVRGLSTSYSFWSAGRPVIAVGTSGNWFYQNWSLAHELGHIALGHQGVLPGDPATEGLEKAANAFAAELLLPESLLRSVNWTECPLPLVAHHLWTWGVSVQALDSRLRSLGLSVSSELSAALKTTTQGFLRRNGSLPLDGGKDPITERMTEAGYQFFPEHVKLAHVQAISEGRLGRGTLAWMLSVPEDAVEIEPAEREPLRTGDELLALFG